jgi:VanZ family protein
LLLPLRYGRHWLFAGLAMLAVALGVALTPTSGLPPLDYNDKVVHVLAFVGFMAWFSGLFQWRYTPWLALALFAYGGLMELLQGLTPSREADGADLIADAFGILLGWLSGLAGVRHWGVRVEQWLAARGS